MRKACTLYLLMALPLLLVAVLACGPAAEYHAEQERISAMQQEDPAETPDPLPTRCFDWVEDDGTQTEKCFPYTTSTPVPAPLNKVRPDLVGMWEMAKEQQAEQGGASGDASSEPQLIALVIRIEDGDDGAAIIEWLDDNDYENYGDLRTTEGTILVDLQVLHIGDLASLRGFAGFDLDDLMTGADGMY